jgi:hypothetical protein
MLTSRPGVRLPKESKGFRVLPLLHGSTQVSQAAGCFTWPQGTYNTVLVLVQIWLLLTSCALTFPLLDHLDGARKG